MPKGFIAAYIVIIIKQVFSSIPDSANERPSVRPSAHLWHTTAKDKARTLDNLVDIPIANPSNTAWIPIAIYNK